MTAPMVFVRPDGRTASRASLLVLPSVVCANAVSVRIASMVPGAVAVTHQHGCAQIGDDAVQTGSILRAAARHPNAWATLVVSLGCETLQGRLIVDDLQECGIPCALTGIQDAGGSRGAVAAGVEWLDSLDPVPDRVAGRSDVLIGVAYSGETGALAVRYARALEAAGFAVATPVDITAAPVLGLVDLVLDLHPLAILHVADRGMPTGPVLVPLLSVAADEELFAGAEGDYDLLAPRDAELVGAMTALVSGEPSAAEQRGDAHFLVRRTLLTL